jgi:hypothetical protein
MGIAVPKLVPGRIVVSNDFLPDPQNRNPKRRPFAIISSVSEIKAGGPYVGIAITSTIKNEDDEVPLPWTPDGNCFSRLNKPGVAKACWKHEFIEGEFEITRGMLIPTLVKEIIAKRASCPDTDR